MARPHHLDPANLSGVHAAPNIQSDPDLHEIENRAANPPKYYKGSYPLKSKDFPLI